MSNNWNHPVHYKTYRCFSDPPANQLEKIKADAAEAEKKEHRKNSTTAPIAIDIQAALRFEFRPIAYGQIYQDQVRIFQGLRDDVANFHWGGVIINDDYVTHNAWCPEVSVKGDCDCANKAA